jgi:hypothetical protein
MDKGDIMNKYFTIFFTLLSFLSCKENDKKLESIKAKLNQCVAYDFFSEIEESKTKIILDSFCFDKNKYHYAVTINNNSDSVIMVKTYKMKLDTLYYFHFREKRFYLDSSGCKKVGGGIDEYWSADTIKEHYIYPNQKLFLDRNIWVKYFSRSENLLFLEFTYYIGKSKKEARSGSFFELKDNKGIKLY